MPILQPADLADFVYHFNTNTQYYNKGIIKKEGNIVMFLFFKVDNEGNMFWLFNKYIYF